MKDLGSINTIQYVKDREIEDYIQSLLDINTSNGMLPIRLAYKRSITKFIDALADRFEFAKGGIYVGDHFYEYLIEGWESICIEKDVEREKGDWDDYDYLYALVDEKHNMVVQTDFLDRYKKVELIIDELRDGSQYGLSVILAKIVKE